MRILGNRWLLGLAASGAVVVTGAIAGSQGFVDLADDRVVVSLDAAPYYSCPDGTEIGEFHRGDRVLVTARDGAGDWFQVRAPFDLDARVWVRAPHVVPDTAIGDLPLADCGSGFAAPEEPTPTVMGSTEVAGPTETTTPIRGSVPGASTSPTRGTTPTTGTSGTTGTTTPGSTQPPSTTATSAPPGSTSTTTAPSDTTGPALGTITASPSVIWEIAGEGCSPVETIVRVSVTDPSGIQWVRLRWRVGSVDDWNWMTPDSIPPDYTRQLWGFGNVVSADEPVELTVTAADGLGNVSERVSTTALTLKNCTLG